LTTNRIARRAVTEDRMTCFAAYTASDTPNSF